MTFNAIVQSQHMSGEKKSTTRSTRERMCQGVTHSPDVCDTSFFQRHKKKMSTDHSTRESGCVWIRGGKGDGDRDTETRKFLFSFFTQKSSLCTDEYNEYCTKIEVRERERERERLDTRFRCVGTPDKLLLE